MDRLNFISNVIASLVWPTLIGIGLFVFREPVRSVMLSLKRVRIKDLEFELVDSKQAGDQEISTIAPYLQRSPHSFQWFRENTEFQYTNQEFSELVAKNAEVLENVTIVSRDENKRRNSPGLPGMRLTPKAKQRIEKAIQNS